MIEIMHRLLNFTTVIVVHVNVFPPHTKVWLLM
jgi:hypothetical protein